MCKLLSKYCGHCVNIDFLLSVLVEQIGFVDKHLVVHTVTSSLIRQLTLLDKFTDY